MSQSVRIVGFRSVNAYKERLRHPEAPKIKLKPRFNSRRCRHRLRGSTPAPQVSISQQRMGQASGLKRRLGVRSPMVSPLCSFLSSQTLSYMWVRETLKTQLSLRTSLSYGMRKRLRSLWKSSWPPRSKMSSCAGTALWRSVNLNVLSTRLTVWNDSQQ